MVLFGAAGLLQFHPKSVNNFLYLKDVNAIPTLLGLILLLFLVIVIIQIFISLCIFQPRYMYSKKRK